MDCKKAYSLIQDFVDGTLDDKERRGFERHVGGCSRCLAEIETYRSLNSFLGDMTVEDVPDGFDVPVINFLKSTGRIREPVAAETGARRVLSAVFDWVPARFGVPITVSALALIAFSAFAVVTGRLQELAGKGAVMATETYIGVHETVARVHLADKLGEVLASDFRMIKTILSAGFSLISTAGAAYMIPALGLIIMLTIGLGWYFKTVSKRSAQNASYIF